MNPFYLNYNKSEDRVTHLLIHVLNQCGLTNQFLKHTFQNCIFENALFYSELQMHREFHQPVKNAFVLSISNTGQISDTVTLNEKESGHPDALFYDTHSQTLVIVEVKIGKGVLSQNQIERHLSKVKDFPRNQWIHETITWSSIKDFFKNSLHDNCTELQNYILNNFIGVINDEIIGYKYDEDYFLWLSGHNKKLMTNILKFLSSLKLDYIKNPHYGSHNEIRYLIGNRRFITFILNKNRLILHPGGEKGLRWRKHIQENYGIFYDQGESYPSELCIPFASINDESLNLIPNSETFQIDEFFNLKSIILNTLLENRNLKKHVSNMDLITNQFAPSL